MIFVHKETKAKFETDNKNLVSMLEREGYELAGEEKEEKAELLERAKALGIKATNSMKMETLLKKIEEAEAEEKEEKAENAE
ncbi:hypothetical protein [Anaerovorax sp. IOR16]|uniref:hypothetical protein n=1 Tax=Anaerovorax sp. IOR16 TaxID=2773458 RepID=UPI0019CF8382|nr:hypothetical protein [Anaerovorax sp. IOR16]